MSSFPLKNYSVSQGRGFEERAHARPRAVEKAGAKGKPRDGDQE